MKVLRKLVLAVGILALGGEALAQIGDLNSAINKAGRERMLSQRMAKAYFQIGQQVDVERSAKILDTSTAQFDKQLVELKNFAPTPEIKETFLKLEKAWLTYKDLLHGAAPSPANGRKVLEISDQVLTLANQATAQLEKLATATNGRLVNISGRQRMLSQRMAKLYQAMAWGIGDAASAAELEKTRKEFSAALQELSAAPANTTQIKDGIELVKVQWFFFENTLLLKSNSNHKRAQVAVASTSERILEEMENVVGLYEKQGR